MRTFNLNGKKMKDALLGAFCLFLTVILAACGNTGENTGGQSAPSDSGTTPPPAAATYDIPYSIEIANYPIAGMPTLHSFAIAEQDGKVVLLSGRTNGMHGFPGGLDTSGGPSFPTQYANDMVYVVDLAAGTVSSGKSVKGLGDKIWPQLASTNTQYIVDNGWLYILGGYGVTAGGQTMITFPQATAINLTALIDTVSNPSGQLDAAFAQANIATLETEAAKITGGALMKLGDKFLLVFGHAYDGEYTVGGGGVTQVYGNSIRVFDMSVSTGSGSPVLSLTNVLQNPSDPLNQDPSGPYHRRDLTVSPAMATDGTALIGIYGGVFKGGDFEGYVTPMYAKTDSGGTAGIDLSEDTGATQWLSQYHCALLQLFSASGKSMYSTFLGGISQYYWDGSGLKRDPIDLQNGVDGLPFINSVSTLKVMDSGGSSVTNQYLHQGLVFPPSGQEPTCPDGNGGSVTAMSLGAETDFVVAEGVPVYSNGVINLDAITSPTMIGYLVCGMAAAKPYSAAGPTCASGLIYKVTLNPGQPSDTVALTAP